MNKSAKCMQQEHDLCDGNIIETIKDSTVTRICECQCHDNMYKLVSRMHAANIINWRTMTNFVMYISYDQLQISYCLKR
jgi:hypothetical protein